MDTSQVRGMTPAERELIEKIEQAVGQLTAMCLYEFLDRMKARGEIEKFEALLDTRIGVFSVLKIQPTPVLRWLQRAADGRWIDVRGIPA